MIELFNNGTEAIGWIILGGAWAMQIGLLILAVLGLKKWQWRLMFAAQILLTCAAIVLNYCYNHQDTWMSMRYLDDALNTLITAVLFCITLFVSWVFWMNRKEGRSAD